MSTHSPADRTGFAAAADRFAGLMDPSMGDEREQSIILRAGTVAMTTSIFTIQLLAVVMAVIGVGMWSLVVALAAIVPSLVYTWYCRSSGLDTDASLSRVAPRRMLWTNSAAFGLAFAWIGAVGFHLLQGRPLVEVGVGSIHAGDQSTASGLVVGGLVGGAAGLIVTAVRWRRGARQEASQQEAEED